MKELERLLRSMAEEDMEMNDFSSRTIVIEVKRHKLDGWRLIPEGKGPFPGVIFYHGKASSAANFLPIGEELARAEISAVLAFNFRDDKLSHRMEDGQDALDFFKFHPRVNMRKIGIVGVSMGGYIAAIIAGKNPEVKSLVLRAPASYIKGKPSSVSEKSLSIQAIRSFTGALLVVESEHDEIIPKKLVQFYLDNAVCAKRKEHLILKGAKHYLGDADSPFRVEFKKVVVNWFKNTLPA